MHMYAIIEISVFLQLFAAFLALRLIPVTGGRRAWVLISGAFILMALRRILSLMQPESAALATSASATAEELVALITSALLLVGIAWIAPMFRSVKATNEALAQSEAKYRELVQNANSIILRLDPQGRITFFNEFAQSFFGYSEAEILGRPGVGTIVPPIDSQGRNLAGIMAHMVAHPERYPTYENENLRRNGEPVWVSWTNKAIRDEEGRLIEILSIGNDATAYKKTREALQEQSWLLEAFFQHTITPLVILDRDFNCLRVNQAYARACQRQVEDFSGHNHFDFFPRESQAIFARAVQTKAPHQALAQALSFPDHPEWGVTYWDWTLTPILNEQGEVAFLVFSLKDVTERQNAAAALQESEEKYRLLVSNIPALVFKGYPDWSVEFPDHKIEELTGYPKEEFDSRRLRWSDLVLAEDLPELKKVISAALKKDKSYTRTYRIKSQDGRIIWIEERGLINCDPRGAVVSISGVFYDITRSKDTEQALKQSQEQLLQAQKMEAVGRLAGGVAHDFNNLLTGILGYADLLLEDLDSQDPVRWEVEEIKKAGGRAASLTRQLLAFSRKQILQPQKLNLNTVVRDMRNLLGRLIGEDIRLVTELDPELGLVEADPSQVEQVIINLAVNARDAMPQGGKLTVETATVELDGAYACRDVNFLPGSYVMLAVTDNGVGMDEETLGHIFEPFFTTKGSARGTGLGLSTVYGIVKQSGGYIWVYSEPKWGTTFKIYLPLAAPAQEEERASSEIAYAVRGWETVLLVEDEEAVRSLAYTVLRKKGYQVLLAANPEEALSICYEVEGPIHLLLTDVVMPGMSGKELADRLTLRFPDLKVLYISGYAENAISHHGLLDPGINFLAKPFNPGTLATRVRRVLDMSAPTAPGTYSEKDTGHTLNDSQVSYKPKKEKR